MRSAPDVLTRAPAVLAPAVRLIEPPPLIEPAQQPLLPWPEPELCAAPEPPGIADEVRRQVGVLAAALVEVLRGRRPLPHLEGHASPPVRELIERLRTDGPLPMLRLRSLRMGQPAPGVVEAAARLRIGERSRAMALRAERDAAARWRLTELELCLDEAGIRRSQPKVP